MIRPALDYPFTEAEIDAAARTWGCNCGPAALAFACQVGLDVARRALPEFDARRYTSPQMMRAALGVLGREHDQVAKPDRGSMVGDRVALVRVQWAGPWTRPGANPRWAYAHTHWITTWTDRGVALVFDVNAGAQYVDDWVRETVPAMLATHPRADGGWYPTHVWRLRGVSRMVAGGPG